MELRQRLLLILGWAAAALAATATSRAELPALGALAKQGARITAQVVDLGDGRTLEQMQPDLRVSPASLTKLVTTAAVLDAWPGDRSFLTRLLAATAPREGVLEGDLTLTGEADATLDADRLWSLAAQLRDRGVTRVTGQLLVRPALFPTLPCETRDRCQGQARSDRAYNAMLSSISVDYGNWCILVRAAEVGAAAAVRSCSGTALPIPVEGRVLTGTPGSPSSVRIERLTDARGDRLRVDGRVPAGDVQRIYRAMSEPALATGQLLGEMLRQMGVQLGREVRVEAGPAPPGLQVLAEAESLQLREQLARMMRYSNNTIADTLTAALAAERLGRPPQRLSEASEVLLAFLAAGELARSPAPAPVGLPVLASGSGLTPENRLSARDLTGLLAREYRDARRFPAFYGSLVVPREAPFAFLRRGGGADWLDRVALKTGSMNEPYSVAGVAGYLRRRDGGWMAFAVIVNGSDARRQIPLDEAIRAARTDLEGVLARY